MDNEVIRHSAHLLTNVGQGVLGSEGAGQLHLVRTMSAEKVCPWGVQPFRIAYDRLLLGKHICFLTDLVILINLLLYV